MLDDLAAALRDPSLHGALLVAPHECLCWQNQAGVAQIPSSALDEVHAWLMARSFPQSVRILGSGCIFPL